MRKNHNSLKQIEKGNILRYTSSSCDSINWRKIKITFFLLKNYNMYERIWKKMVIWFIVGLSIVCVWIWYLLFTLEYKTSRHAQKLSSRYTVKTRNINDAIIEVKKKTALLLHNLSTANKCESQELSRGHFGLLTALFQNWQKVSKIDLLQWPWTTVVNLPDTRRLLLN